MLVAPFPGDDVGGARQTATSLSLEKRPTYVDVGKLLARWHPYQGADLFPFGFTYKKKALLVTELTSRPSS
jgi:hypothetical protein